MIHYHGTPISGCGIDAARFLKGRHAFVSFAAPTQLPIVAEVCASFALDNGAFSAWRSGKPFNFAGYREWCKDWLSHPACDWCVIPDVIDGDESQNDMLIDSWTLPTAVSVPVWHMHESIARLMRLCLRFPRVAIGSSGKWPNPGCNGWWTRINEAMEYICQTSAQSRPPCKLHGLRMLDPKIFSRLPFSSADSTNVGRNCGIDSKWQHANSPVSRHLRCEIIADRIESFQSLDKWAGGCTKQQGNLFEED